MGVTMYKQYQQSDPFNYHIQYIHYAPYGELIESISPYAYCALNPVKYTDPDGREIINKMDPMIDKSLHDAGKWKIRKYV
jgi:hypothetical protein